MNLSRTCAVTPPRVRRERGCDGADTASMPPRWRSVVKNQALFLLLAAAARAAVARRLCAACLCRAGLCRGRRRQNIAVSGYDAVSYFEGDGVPVKGDAAFAVEHDGAVYHFASAAHAAKFRGRPGGVHAAIWRALRVGDVARLPRAGRSAGLCGGRRKTLSELQSGGEGKVGLRTARGSSRRRRRIGRRSPPMRSSKSKGMAAGEAAVPFLFSPSSGA